MFEMCCLMYTILRFLICFFADFRNIVVRNVVSFSSRYSLAFSSFIISSEQYSEIMLSEISKSPLEQISDNYDQSVNFCMLCVDKQRMLAQENGRGLLDKVMDVNNWDMQTPELVSAIIAQYSPSVSETT